MSTISSREPRHTLEAHQSADPILTYLCKLKIVAPSLLYPSKVQLIMAKHLPGDLSTKGKAGNLKNMRLNLKGFFWEVLQYVKHAASNKSPLLPKKKERNNIFFLGELFKVCRQ